MDFQKSDDWYFGDYHGHLPGKFYSVLLDCVIITLFVQIALTTEPTLDTRTGDIFLTFALDLIEIFFISDYIGKVANSWSRYEYGLFGLVRVVASRSALIDLAIVLLLLTDLFDNDSFVVIGVYTFKAAMSIYYSSFQVVIRRVKFILLDSPAYTFFPLILLAIVTYVLAFCMYLLERSNDPQYFGSIVRAFWFSIVTMTTIGYGDITPSSSLGKIIAILFGLVGIVCIALLTANILEANAKFNELDSN
ncbi:MAG: two pore domain potassium channel family protein [Synechococcus sp. BS307-5m-G38]|nr:two pore domain potassium channel family protein [Synechococcus sp. BS307-5m-G38]